MALRFLADHCFSNSNVRSLRDAAHEVVRLKDVLPVELPGFDGYRKSSRKRRDFVVAER
jgi:hypothetical protein